MKHNFLLKRLIFAFTADNSTDRAAARKTTNFGYCNSHRVRRKASGEKSEKAKKFC
jgi:hypothetical protein